jgi:hypothetical protein
MGIDELDQFIEDRFLNESFLIDSGSKLFEVYGRLDRFSQASDQSHINVSFEKCCTDLFDYAIECLESGRMTSRHRALTLTFSSRLADLVRSLTAALIRRPRSWRTILKRLCAGMPSL